MAAACTFDFIKRLVDNDDLLKIYDEFKLTMGC